MTCGPCSRVPTVPVVATPLFPTHVGLDLRTRRRVLRYGTAVDSYRRLL